MSVAISNELTNLLSVLDGGTTSSAGASGSGTFNFLQDLNLTSLSTSTSSPKLSDLSSLFGPGVSSVIGFASNLIPGLDGFLSSGFDFTCLGSQAFGKKQLDDTLNFLKVSAERAKTDTTGNELCHFLNDCDATVHESIIEISRYRSGCSKSLRTKVKDIAQSMIDAVDKTNLVAKSVNRTMWNGESYTGTDYSQGSNFNSVTPQNLTIDEFNTSVKPKVEAYALQNGLDPVSSVQSVYDAYFKSTFSDSSGNPVIAGGAVTYDENGNIDWNVSAGTSQKDNTVTYIGLAIVALLGYKFLIKK